MNNLSFILSENIFISPLFFKNIFTGAMTSDTNCPELGETSQVMGTVLHKTIITLDIHAW